MNPSFPNYNMSARFRWEGDLLVGPVAEMIDTIDGVLLPRGPPSTGPFSTGQWSVMIRKPAGFKEWRVGFAWTAETQRSSAMYALWQVVIRDSSAGLKPVWGIEPVGRDLGDKRKSEYYGLIGAPYWLRDHARAGSDFVATMVCLDQPLNIPPAQPPASCLTTRDITTFGKQTPLFVAKPVSNLVSLVDVEQLISPQAFDVSLVFAEANTLVWAKADSLTAESGSFRELLSSNFAEGELTLGGPLQPAPRLTLEAAPEFDGSAAKFYIIRVYNASRETFTAVLTWIHRGQITLTNPADEASDLPVAKRARTSASSTASTSTTPAGQDSAPAISWRSAFEAAVALEIPRLKDLALVKFKTTLTVENVVTQLFSPLSVAYADVREVAMEFAVANSKASQRRGGGRRCRTRPGWDRLRAGWRLRSSWRRDSRSKWSEVGQAGWAGGEVGGH